MTPTELQAMCTHAPYYQKGCIACNVRYVKMLRSPDARLSRKLQDAFLNSMPVREKQQTIEILKEERA